MQLLTLQNITKELARWLHTLKFVSNSFEIFLYCMIILLLIFLILGEAYHLINQIFLSNPIFRFGNQRKLVFELT
jgi:TRAP-type C4-dicarboxylate transport system permease large subunit